MLRRDVLVAQPFRLAARPLQDVAQGLRDVLLARAAHHRQSLDCRNRLRPQGGDLGAGTLEEWRDDALARVQERDEQVRRLDDLLLALLREGLGGRDGLLGTDGVLVDCHGAATASGRWVGRAGRAVPLGGWAPARWTATGASRRARAWPRGLGTQLRLGLRPARAGGEARSQLEHPLDPGEVESRLRHLLDAPQTRDVRLAVEAGAALRPRRLQQPPPFVQAERLWVHAGELGGDADHEHGPVLEVAHRNSRLPRVVPVEGGERLQRRLLLVGEPGGTSTRAGRSDRRARRP